MMIGVHIKEKAAMTLWVLTGLLLGAATLTEAAENWQTEPYDYYHSQYRYSQEGRYPENPQGGYSGNYSENREWRYGYGYVQNGQSGYTGNRGFAGYPPENAPREYERNPRGYPEPQREYSYNGYPGEGAPREYARDPRGRYPETPAPQPQRGYVPRSGTWYPPEERPREYARQDPRGRYPEPRREYGREYGRGEYMDPRNAPRGYSSPQGYAGDPRGTYVPPQPQGGGYPPRREPREYDRDPRGGYVPEPPREYGRGGYSEPRGGYGYSGGYSEGGYYSRDEYFQERYENILQEYLGGRYPSGGPGPYAPYRY